ncbi:MAG: MGDG synthase family glycosyltransferase [Chloroflexota bacterium]
MNEPNILLLTADVGFGHRAACQAVETALRQVSNGACRITLLNVMHHPRTPRLMRFPERGYDLTVNSRLRLYSLSYRASDSPLACELVGRIMVQGLARVTQQVFNDLQPDAVLSTFHLYQAPVLAACKRSGSQAPFFSVVTDLADVHQIWFRAAPDVLFVPNEMVRDQALAAGLASEQVVVSGIPVQPALAAEQRSKTELRQALGWLPHLPAALVVGSRRTPTLVEKVAAVNQAGLPLQLAISAGGDEKLYRRLQAVDWRMPVHLYRYVSNMPELMHAADLIISKAGGLITAESLACGLPLIYTGYIPGQESGNLTYVVGQGAGAMANTPRRLVQTLASWLADDGLGLRQYTARARRLGSPCAAQLVASHVWQAAGAFAAHRAA